MKERTEAAREAAREFVTEYLLNHPCIQCGERDIRALEFHHRDANEKDLAITRMVTGGWSVKRIEAEISKCDVLCASCHRKLTADERGWYRSKR